MKNWIVLGLIAAFSLALNRPSCGAPPVAKSAKAEINEARRTGWQLAKLIVEKLEKDDPNSHPELQPWLKDYQKIAQGIDPKAPIEQWPQIDADALLTRNPNFWQAYYQIAPGDPGLMLLHGGLLLSGGEANRAQQVIVIAGQRPGVPKEFQQIFEIVLAQSEKIRDKPNALVLEGTTLFDKGDYAGALKKYEAALALWPQNGFAHYEVGMTIRDQRRVADGKKPYPANAVVVNDKEKILPEVMAEFAKARQHDPFQVKAYQGDNQEVIRGYLALTKTTLPAWQTLVKNRKGQVPDQLLEQLAASFQEANIPELALVTRQVLVARHQEYTAADHPYITKSLTKLVPGKQTEAVLARLASGKLQVRLLVAPEIAKP
jgi:tetratricopeptide (TPR) repeat protein